MSAELVVHLMEHGVSLEQAKAIDATAPASVAELTIAILETVGGDLGLAKLIAVDAPFTVALRRVSPRELPALQPTGLAPVEDGEEPEQGDEERARVYRHSPVGADGLTDAQRSAVGKQGLCPNCQQPNNAHLPGCARASGEDPKARTVNALPPAV